MILSFVQIAFVFLGGGEAELCAKIKSYSDEPVILFAHGQLEWRKSTLEDERDAIIRRRILTSFRYRGRNQDGWGIGTVGWPLNFLRKQSAESYDRFFRDGGKVLIDANGVVKLPVRASSSDAYQLTDFKDIKLDKPIRWHWFFDNARFYVQPNNCSSLKFWKLVTAAMGGRWIEQQNEYVITLDPKVMREKWRDVPRTTGTHDNADFVKRSLLHTSVMYQMSDNELLKFYEDPKSRKEFKVSKNSQSERLCFEIVEDVKRRLPKNSFLHTEFDPSHGFIIVCMAYKTPAIKVYNKDKTYNLNF